MQTQDTNRKVDEKIKHVYAENDLKSPPLKIATELKQQLVIGYFCCLPFGTFP